jgi:hypothetical protein
LLPSLGVSSKYMSLTTGDPSTPYTEFVVFAFDEGILSKLSKTTGGI